VLGVDDLPERIRTTSPASVALVDDDPSALCTLRALENRYVARVMTLLDGNKTAAARVLGIDRTTLYRKLEEIERETKGKS
jgi:two-component system response regulator HydG